MKIGCHVSIAGGIENAPSRARQLDCESFQMFTRSPRGGKAKEITPQIAQIFLDECEKADFKPSSDYVTHTSYFINLASENNRIYYGSISSLRKELEVASLIKAPFVITHIGSSKDLKGKNIQKQINKKVMKGIKKIHENYQGEALLVLEIAAGSGNIIGDNFEEIGFFIKQAKKDGINLGFCFDTCHSFAAGYDLRTSQSTDQVFEQIDKIIGIENLKCIHFNDSMAPFDSHKDQHEHIGKGEIGEEGLKEVINQVKGLDINVILETKHDKIEEDLELTKNFAK
ncbi:MAG: deoxyribonuclease IV [Patescibacteria group bacterium]|nr:deoxyribonuclease IV [Patescibacteria group bacterium]